MSSDELSVVLGDQRYRVRRPWGQWPGSMTRSQISQLAVDSQGMVYVFQRGEPPVLAFSPSGALRHGLAEAGSRMHTASRSRRTTCWSDRDAHQILILSTDGEILATLGERHRPRLGAPFNHPADAAVAADGEIYVADGTGTRWSTASPPTAVIS